MDGFGGSTLYDLLIFKTIDRYGEDAHLDADTEGDHLFLDALASSVCENDDDYIAALEALKEKAAKEKPRNFSDDQWDRLMNYEHLKLIITTLRDHGVLDSAPIAATDDGSDFLAA